MINTLLRLRMLLALMLASLVKTRLLSVACSTVLETKALGYQTKVTVPLFVLLIKYAHIRDTATHLACRVLARVSVHSPCYPKSRGGSHIREDITLDGYAIITSCDVAKETFLDVLSTFQVSPP